MPDENQQPTNTPPSPRSSPDIHPILENSQNSSQQQGGNKTSGTTPYPQTEAPLNARPFTDNAHLETDVTQKKPSKWHRFFKKIFILQMAGVALFLIAMLWAILQASVGVSGTEFIGLILYITIVPAVAILSLINVIGLPIYILKEKLRGTRLSFAVFLFAFSGLLVFYGGYNFLVLTVNRANLEDQYKQETEKIQQAIDNANPEITKEEAIELLKTCQLSGFYYTSQTGKSDSANSGRVELSSTGVVLTTVSGKPHGISIADRLIPELLPIARQAQKTCGNLQFWYDGRRE